MPGGVWWVELAANREAGAVEPLIASSLGITAGVGDSPRQRIVGAIGDRELLLVLDNCEHLLPSVVSFATDALAACAQLRVLAPAASPRCGRRTGDAGAVVTRRGRRVERVVPPEKLIDRSPSRMPMP